MKDDIRVLVVWDKYIHYIKSLQSMIHTDIETTTLLPVVLSTTGSRVVLSTTGSRVVVP